MILSFDFEGKMRLEAVEFFDGGVHGFVAG